MSDNDNAGAKRRQEPLSLKDLVITSTTEEFSDTTPPTVSLAAAQGSNASGSAASPAMPLPSAIPVTLTRLYHFKTSLTDGNDDSSSSITIPTNCFVQLFGNSTTVVMGISQDDGHKIGNYLLCEAEPNPLQHKTYQYQVTHLLGGQRDDTLLGVYAKRIAEVLVGTVPPLQPLTLVLGISLLSEEKRRGQNDNNNNNESKDRIKAARSPEVFRSVVDVMARLYVEAVNRSTDG